MQLFRLLFTIARHSMRPSVFPRTSLKNAIFVPNIACRPVEGWLVEFFQAKRVLSNSKRIYRKYHEYVSFSLHNTRISSSFVRYYVWCISALKVLKNMHASFIAVTKLAKILQNPVSCNKNVKLPTRNNVNLTSLLRATARCLWREKCKYCIRVYPLIRTLQVDLKMQRSSAAGD